MTEAEKAFGDNGTPPVSWRTRHAGKLRLGAYLLLASATVFASARTFQLADQNRVALEQIEREGVERRDQACTQDERAHLADVDQLKQTYLYLVNLPEEEWTATSLNRTVIANVPRTEEEAHTDVAPEFCDETLTGENGEKIDVGLPEPDPEIPERPDKVDEMIQAVAQADRQK